MRIHCTTESIACYICYSLCLTLFPPQSTFLIIEGLVVVVWASLLMEIIFFFSHVIYQGLALSITFCNEAHTHIKMLLLTSDSKVLEGQVYIQSYILDYIQRK